jgi:hypothetical protein
MKLPIAYLAPGFQNHKKHTSKNYMFYVKKLKHTSAFGSLKFFEVPAHYPDPGNPGQDSDYAE